MEKKIFIVDELAYLPEKTTNNDKKNWKKNLLKIFSIRNILIIYI